MDVRVITLRYQDALQGFSEEALRKAISGREVLEAREHFFMHGNVPHLLLTLLLGDVPAGGEVFRRREGADPEEGLEESRRPLYRELKRWRNERARADGKPAYAIARNTQLAEIARRVPRSLADLKEADGIGEAFCRDYGAEVLRMRIGRTSCVSRRVRDTAKSDNGASVKSLEGLKGRGSGRFGRFLRPGVDGGPQKTYAVAVFRSGTENRSDVRARARLHGELRRVGCVREGYNVPSGVGVRIDGDVFGTVTPFDQRGGYRRGADRHPQTGQNFAYRLGRVDRAEDAHPAAATVARQRIDGEHPLQQFRPGRPASRQLLTHLPRRGPPVRTDRTFGGGRRDEGVIRQAELLQGKQKVMFVVCDYKTERMQR